MLYGYKLDPLPYESYFIAWTEKNLHICTSSQGGAQPKSAVAQFFDGTLQGLCQT